MGSSSRWWSLLDRFPERNERTLSSQGPPREEAKLSSMASSLSELPGKKLSESVRELHVPEGEVDMEIIFFHGLDFGEQRDANCRAWMSDDGSECWPQKWLPEHFTGARILAVSYDASAVRTSSRGWMDVEVIAENLVRDLILCKDVAAGQGSHRPLVLVGHSVGGLVVKQLCRHAFHKMSTCEGRIRDESDHKSLKTFLKNLRGIFYYSTPHDGSEVANFAPRNKRGRIMEIMDSRNKNVAILQSEFNGIRQRYKDAWKLAGVAESQETRLPGFTGVVVEMNSARFGNDFGEHSTLSEDHFSICRPKGRTASAYKILVNFLTDIQEQDKAEDDIQSIWCGQKFLVGLELRVQDIKTNLQTSRRMGLYGMAGVGKTTLARAVLDVCHLEFEYSCWISDLKESTQRQSGPRLKADVLEGLLKRGKKVSQEDADWDILKGKKVLLVIDNEDSEFQLEKSQIPLKNWFGNESRMVVTSRDEGFCKRFGKAWKVEFLSNQQSWDLFLHHSFGNLKYPPKVIWGEFEKVLKCCGGVPLVIEIIGRTLHEETDKKEWEATIQKLKEGEPLDGNKDECLLNRLCISYDRLCGEEQKIFLDSALLLMNEPLSRALQIWEASWGCGVTKSWKNLTLCCLVDVKKVISPRGADKVDRVWVHAALRMLAQNIACPKHDEGHMRNWHVIVDALLVMELLNDSSQEPCKAEALVHEPNRSNRLPPSSLHCQKISAARFPHLRLLTLVNVQILGGATHLPSGLVYLRWSYAASQTLPFLLRHLTKLCCLDLSGCEALKSIPKDVDGLTALTWLQLEICHALSSLPDGIGNLGALVYLAAENSGLRKIPDSLGKLTNLETLILRNSLASKLPNSLGKLTNLRVVEANSTPLVELPFSIGNWQSMSRLDLSRTSVSNLPNEFGAMRNLYSLDLSYTKLKTLPESFTGLAKLYTLRLVSTPLRCLADAFGSMRELHYLNISHTRVEELPTSFERLANLSDLRWSGCKKLCLPGYRVIYRGR